MLVFGTQQLRQFACLGIFALVGGSGLFVPLLKAQEGDTPASSRLMNEQFEALQSYLQEQIQSGEYAKGVKAIEAALAVDSEDYRANTLRQKIALAVMRRQPEFAMELMKKQWVYELARLNDPRVAVHLGSTLQAATHVFAANGTPDQSVGWSERSLRELDSHLPAGSPHLLHLVRADVVFHLAALNREADEERASQLIRDEVELAEAMIAKHPDAPAALAYLMRVSQGEVAFATDPSQPFARLEKWATRYLALEPANQHVLNSYLSSCHLVIPFLAQQDPALAEELLERAGKVIEDARRALGSPEKWLTSYERTLGKHRATIDRSRRQRAMLGKLAPAYDVKQWINGEPIDPLSLKGKVILLDFWAVWCEACIATFPHLRHLQEEYGASGLQIIGVTRPYSYRWNDLTQSIEKSEDPVPWEAEMKMVQLFMQQYQLKHPTIVTPEESRMLQQYSVGALPHAILIDKSGLIRMIRVGNSSRNAEDLEAMIQQLLAE